MANQDIDATYDLTGRVALITGASSHGIGNAAARELAARGAKVFLTARREDRLREAADLIEQSGGTAAYKATDVSNEDECQAAVQACLDTFGRLDIMVLAAGISGASPSGGPDSWFDADNWKKVQSINLDGTFYMVKYGWQACAEHGVGSIVLVGSLASWRADGHLAYAATKGAIRAMTPWLGKNLASYGVRVNALYPGLTDTDMTHRATEYAPYADQKLQEIPLHRFGTPEDCAHMVAFLASDASLWVTGQHFVVDGGELSQV